MKRTCKHSENCLTCPLEDCVCQTGIYRGKSAYNSPSQVRYRENNKEKTAEYQKLYRERNKERLSRKHQAYYMKHRETLIERQKSYYAANRIKILAYAKMRRGKNKTAQAE
jgi:hypothetical protein